MPPRSGKSLLCSQALVSWWLGRNPTDSAIIASYGSELAERNSRHARSFFSSPGWPFPDVRVSDESAAVARWATNRGGEVRAAGTGGSITGHGAHLFVLDDPIRGHEDADSEAVRESVWEWWTSTALTRLMPGGAMLVVGTRWHADDLIGRLLASPASAGWETLTLPAIAEDEDDPLGREPGAALWPEWFDEAYLESLRGELGERAWRALYQQQPTSEKGGIFKREWLQGRYESTPRSGLTQIVTAVDSSFGKGISSDRSAIVSIGSDGREFFVGGALAGRWQLHDLLAAIKREADWHKPHVVLVEDAASGQSAIQELKRTSGLPIVAVKPRGSKISRAEAVAPLFESGRVLFPEHAATWREEVVEELASFPAGRHDDLVDALVYALERLRGVTGRAGALPSIGSDGLYAGVDALRGTAGGPGYDSIL